MDSSVRGHMTNHMNHYCVIHNVYIVDETWYDCNFLWNHFCILYTNIEVISSSCMCACKAGM